jgi:glycosyltransferase involved in cell wall biosynthesis
VSISRYTDELVKPLAKKTWLLPNAADSRYFGVERTPTTPPVMLFVGGLDERKNPIAYISACRDLFMEHGWRLRLCGTGNEAGAYVRELMALAAQNPWIELAGWKSREELLAEMREAGALVLPTLEDNCPMVVLEAMAVGLPVMASRVGGIPDLITDGQTGLMFDPLDPQSMRNATCRMMENSSMRRTMSAAAQEEAIRRFHPNVVAEAHLKIYREVLSSL